MLGPDIVLIEAPREADSVLALAGDPAMEPPVALLGYLPDQPERAAFFPLARFSPEWIALRHAAALGVPVRSIDLPLANSLALAPERSRRIPSDPIALLAAAAGESDPERWWEDVVEHRGADDSDDGPFAAIAEAMAAVRGDDEAVGEEALREAAMRRVSAPRSPRASRRSSSSVERGTSRRRPRRSSAVRPRPAAMRRCCVACRPSNRR